MVPLASGLLVQVVQPWLLVAGRNDWPQWLLAWGQAMAAFTCVAAAGRIDVRGAHILIAVAVLLIGLALIDLFRADALLVYLARHVAQGQGWYDARRVWQGLVLLLACGVLLPVCVRWWLGGSGALADGMGRVLAGAGVLVALLILRLVSLHHTDWLLDLRIAAISVGRWVTVLGLVLVASGSWRILKGE